MFLTALAALLFMQSKKKTTAMRMTTDRKDAARAALNHQVFTNANLSCLSMSGSVGNISVKMLLSSRRSCAGRRAQSSPERISAIRLRRLATSEVSDRTLGTRLDSSELMIIPKFSRWSSKFPIRMLTSPMSCSTFSIVETVESGAAIFKNCSINEIKQPFIVIDMCVE